MVAAIYFHMNEYGWCIVINFFTRFVVSSDVGFDTKCLHWLKIYTLGQILVVNCEEDVKLRVLVKNYRKELDICVIKAN
jgi:hypothetical protein